MIMARTTSFLLLSLLSFLLAVSFATARKNSNFLPDMSKQSNNNKNYTKVCHRVRFSKLGLDMNDFAYCDSSLPIATRVKDLVDRMTLFEKVRQLGDRAYGVDRIGLLKYEWWNEALHGVSNVSNFKNIVTFFNDVVPGATSFPLPIHTTASFNESLWKRIGQVVSTEARAMYNLGDTGLTFWSPVINPVRDPRWGRTLETPGEDPYVVGRYAVNFVRGLQDIDGKTNVSDGNARPLKVAACCKHYAAYDVDHWLGVDRASFNALVQQRDMIETFQKPFEMCVLDGDVASIMCSYNQIDGIPSCADPVYLKETIRGKWNLHGYIVSDCDSIQVMVENQKFLGDTPVDATAQVLRAGLDLDCGEYYSNYTADAVLQGKARESDIDSALKNLYTVLMRLGFFDGAPEFEKLGKDDICSKEHTDLAIEAVKQGIVLLKNDNQTLPLNLNKVGNLAVIGPHYNATRAMIGNYAGVPCKYSTPLDGFKEYNKKVIYEPGCDLVACKNDSLIFPAVRAAKRADATVLVMGLDLSVEDEGRDRLDLLLPGYQTQLINQVAMVSKGPVVLVIISAGGVDISFAKSNPNISSILWVGYPGEKGGNGIAEVVFGKYNPGGKLPVTWYENSYVSQLPLTSMAMRPINSLGYPGRTYKFFNGTTVYPFGYGLSYTKFNYTISKSPDKAINVVLDKHTHCRHLKYSENISSPAATGCPAVLVDDLSVQCGEGKYNFEFEVEVKNTGKLDGTETVLVYWVPPEGILDAPIKQLIGFQKVFVRAAEAVSVNFKVDPCKSFGLVDYRSYTLLAKGIHKILLGDNISSFGVGLEIDRPI